MSFRSWVLFQVDMMRHVFFFRHGGSLEGMIVIFVDDFHYAGSEKFHKDFILKLIKVFKVRVQNCESFKY